MEITYDYYRIFYHVAKYGSISRAADALMRGQPNVTKAMQNLELQLGCRLLLRSSRGISLTPEGEKLYRHLAVAFEHITAAEDELLSDRDLHSGGISIATTEVALYGALVPALAAFSTHYPGVKVKVTNSNNRGALHMLKSGLADFALLTTREEIDGSCRATTVKPFREILCAGADSDTEDGLDALARRLYIGCNASTYTHLFCRTFLSSLGIHREPDIEVGTSSQVLQLVKAGIGIGFVSEPIALPLLHNGEIRQLRLDSEAPMREICLVEDKGRTLSIAARRFVQYLK